MSDKVIKKADRPVRLGEVGNVRDDGPDLIQLKTWELIDRNGQSQKIRVTGKEREKLASYQDAVKEAVRTGTSGLLRRYPTMRIRDIYVFMALMSYCSRFDPINARNAYRAYGFADGVDRHRQL